MDNKFWINSTIFCVIGISPENVETKICRNDRKLKFDSGLSRSNNNLVLGGACFIHGLFYLLSFSPVYG